jgi:hypothetical protein
MSAFLLFGTVPTLVHHVADSVLHFVGRFAVRDWILLGGGVVIFTWGWVRAAAFARLGSVEIGDLGVDGDLPPAKQLGAELQASLAARGALPASGVPGGAPSAAAIGAAIADAPVPQANWIGALVGLLPIPPTKTGFQITGTLLVSVTTQTTPCGLAYQVVCSGPRAEVTLGTVWSANWLSVVDAAAHAIFDDMEKSAPDLYPSWARWSSAKAYEHYVRGDAAERDDHLLEAKNCFVSAWELNRDNMLAPLRIANCLERIAMKCGTNEQIARGRTRAEALLRYVDVESREPEIFEAGYRASLVMSALASGKINDAQTRRSINKTLDKLDNSFQATKPSQPFRLGVREAIRRATAKRTGLWLRAMRFAGRQPVQPAGLPAGDPRERLNKHAQRETRLARLRVRPLWTILHENRFRHQFEPRGRARRQIRKALGISAMCRYARQASGRSEKPSDAVQFMWRGWVFWRYMFGRGRVAGWQAHYNAACFYALLPPGSQTPRGSKEPRALRERRIVARALRHLAYARTEAGDELPPEYVRSDPDLDWLREHHEARFEWVVEPNLRDQPPGGGAPCNAFLTVHYARPETDRRWGLHVWGDATVPVNRAWDQPLTPVSSTMAEAMFRVEIVDQSVPLNLLPHQGNEKDLTWTLIPAEWPDEIWLIPDNSAIFTAGAPVHIPTRS